jgi:hypothetical protein
VRLRSAAKGGAPLFLVAWLLTAMAGAAHAAWPTDPLVNLPVCTDLSEQIVSRIASDGAGGAIIVWQDVRNGDYDIYAQRIDVNGVAKWTPNGIPMCAAIGDQTQPFIEPDGAGGAVITWQDQRDGPIHVYAQRVNAAGTVLWGSDGVAVSTASVASFPTIASDGGGGAIIAWQDSRNPSFDIYAQHISAAGSPQWATNGVPVCAATGSQSSQQLVPDGAGGAVVTWMDHRGSTQDIYAQRMNGAGAPQWTPDGVALCVAAHDQWGPQIAADGAQGAIVTWYDQRSDGIHYDIYAQRVTATGTAMWTPDGVALCTQSGDQLYPMIAPDGASGAIVTWQDQRDSNWHIYVQRVNASGATQWTGNGVQICAALYNENWPMIASDGVGGAVVTWQDTRADGANPDIYAQRVNSSGGPLWATDGVAMCTDPYTQLSPFIVASGTGGAIVEWRDTRNQDGYVTTNDDVYAQAVTANGTLGAPLLAVPPVAVVSGLGLRSIAPNPSRGEMRVTFSLPDDAPAHLELFDLAGRRLASRDVGAFGAGTHEVEISAPRAALSSEVCTLRLTHEGESAVATVVIVR